MTLGNTSETNVKTKIFISKKEDDQLHAKKIRMELEPYINDEIEIVMSQDMPAGEIWRDWIRKQLQETDLLLFLFTGSGKNWGWCLFEMGIFTPLQDRKPDPIVCIYPPNEKPPSQIEDFQGVECNVESMQAFLVDLFSGNLTSVPLNSRLAKNSNKIEEISRTIVKILAPKNLSDYNRVYYTRYISLTISEPDVNSKQIPDDAKIEGDALSLEIFKLNEKRPDGSRWNWSEFKPYLVKALVAADSDPGQFLEEFDESIVGSCTGETIIPSQFNIRSLTSKKKYLPVVHRREVYSNGNIQIRVLLVQEPEPDAGERNLTFAAPPSLLEFTD